MISLKQILSEILKEDRWHNSKYSIYNRPKHKINLHTASFSTIKRAVIEHGGLRNLASWQFGGTFIAMKKLLIQRFGIEYVNLSTYGYQPTVDELGDVVFKNELSKVILFKNKNELNKLTSPLFRDIKPKLRNFNNNSPIYMIIYFSKTEKNPNKRVTLEKFFYYNGTFFNFDKPLPTPMTETEVSNLLKNNDIPRNIFKD